MVKQTVEVTYMRRMASTAVVYVIAVMGVTLLINNATLPFFIKASLALLPMLPIMYGLWAYNAFVDEMDELQRLIQSKAIVFAAGLTGILTTGYGFLEAFADFPAIGLLWVFPVMIFLWGIGLFIYGRKYGESDE